jgi:hypothetical protein
MEVSRGTGRISASPKASRYAGSTPGHDCCTEQVSQAATRAKGSSLERPLRSQSMRSKSTVP